MSTLAFGNPTGHITRTISQAPSDMMVRELLQNAIEASQNAESPKIYIMETDPAIFGILEYPLNNLNYYGSGARGGVSDNAYGNKKLTYWNNGRGMTAHQLRLAVDLASSIEKMQSLMHNFGIGAKISALAVNQKGMIWITCKNKVVSLVLLLKQVNEKTGVEEFVRYDFFDTDAQSKSKYKDIVDITGLDTIPWDTNEDWTAIVLCGNNIKQNTAERPYDPQQEEARGWLVNTAYARFYRLDPRIEMRFFTGIGFAHKNSIRFVSIEERIDNLCESQPDKIKKEIVALENGVKIVYVWDGPVNTNTTELDDDGKPIAKNDLSMSIYSNPTSRQSTFSGLVWKNEIYDFTNNNVWRGTAGLLNILYNYKYFRIFVELPDDFEIMPDSHRKKIMINDEHKTEVKLLTFASEIRANMPQWFKDKIKSYAPNNLSANDLQNKAQELLDKLMTQMRGSAAVRSSNGRTNGTRNPPTGKGATHSPPKKKSPLFGGIGAAADIQESFPPIEFIRNEIDLESCSADQLKHRAAQYTETALYINCMYDAVNYAVDAMVGPYLNEDEGTVADIREAAKDIATEEMAWIVSKAVIHSLCKRAKDGYDTADVEIALKPVSLTTHADNLDESLHDCEKRLEKKAKLIKAGISTSNLNANMTELLNLEQA